MKDALFTHRKFIVGFTSFMLTGSLFLSMAQDLRDAHKKKVRTLEELFVITASKKEEEIWEAPGVVTIITARDIQQFGGQSLAEVLARAPGVQKMFTISVPRLTIRGGNASLSNEHVLFLVDGRPHRTANGNHFIYNPLYSFPLERIIRIEIVRGPGSALYGTNALEGVINIITKKNHFKDRISVSLGGGSFGTKTSTAFVEQRSTNFEISAGATYLDRSGWTVDILSAAGEPVSKNVFEDTLGLSVLMRYKHFSLSAFSGRMKRPGFSDLLSLDNSLPPISFHSQVENVDLSYRHVFDQNWNLETNFTYNGEYFGWHREESPGLSTFSNEFLIESITHKRINRKFSFLTGLLINNLRG